MGWDKKQKKRRLEHKSSKFMVYMCHVTCFFFPFIWSSWASQNIISVKLDVKILKEKRDFKKLLGTFREMILSDKADLLHVEKVHLALRGREEKKKKRYTYKSHST